MGCCGKARANLNFSRAVLRRPEQTVSEVRPQPLLRPQPELRSSEQGGHTTMVRYSGASRIVVRGPATGQRYTFLPAHPTQPVDMHDAAALLRIGYFKPA
jgi:hypothetical protein